MFGSLNLGSVNVLNSLDNTLGTAGTASVFTPVDVLVAVGANMGLTYYACNSDSFRIQVPVVSEKIEEMVGDKYGWLGDGRFLLGLAGAAYSHFGAVGSDTRRMLHDITIASWSSVAATEVCRATAEKQMEGGSNMLLGDFGEDDFGLIDDDIVMAESAEFGTMNFAYGW